MHNNLIWICVWLLKLLSLTSPLAIINHVTCEVKPSGLMITSKPDCICMIIQRDLSHRGLCDSQCLFVCKITYKSFQWILLKLVDLWYV